MYKLLKLDGKIKNSIHKPKVDQEWLNEKLPLDDILVPLMELPELECENGNGQETLREQEQKWTDLALSHLNEQS